MTNHITATIAATDEDDKPGRVTVTASPGELPGVLLETSAAGYHTSVSLTLNQADELIAVLMAARAHLTA